MVKKTITYMNPFTERMVTEDHYFHISKADLIEMEVEAANEKYAKNGEELTGMQALLARMVDAKDAPAALVEFKKILRRAYGKRDGDRFIKNADVWGEFEGSEAYSQLIYELLTNSEELGSFIAGVIPGNLEELAAEISARAEAERARQSASTPDDEGSTDDPTGFTQHPTPRVLTSAEAREMDSSELQAGLVDGRYKLS